MINTYAYTAVLILPGWINGVRGTGNRRSLFGLKHRLCRARASSCGTKQCFAGHEHGKLLIQIRVTASRRKTTERGFFDTAWLFAGTGVVSPRFNKLWAFVSFMLGI